jgi:ribosomal protein S24E|tara:strand:- start:682 stop:1047 length:366 start_codon:yes stop_codon:yes gene_type:complete
MDVKITEKKESPLLYRTEIMADITGEKATPSKVELKKKCASILKADEKLIVIKKITTTFGSTNAKAELYQYKDEKKLKSIEHKEKKKEEKKEGEAEEKKEEAKPEEKKEAPKEEKKEEAKK